MTTLAPRLLLLDFDGVIADSVEECLAVTWFADKSIADHTLPQLFAQVPSWFADRFHALRPYSRTLDDFIVAKHAPRDVPVESQTAFDGLKARIAPAEIAEFSATATALRTRWRSEQRRHWLDAHTIFEGVRGLLERHSGNVFVITAKDAPSSLEILTHFGLDRHVAAVVGEVSDKGLAAQCLCLGRGVPLKDALFVDDNLTNVARVQAAGVPARWATWGWTAPEHTGRARRLRLTPLALDELAAV